MTIPNIFFFGYGYVAQHLHQMLPPTTQIGGSRRSSSSQDFLDDFEAIPHAILDQFDYFLISIPPNEQGDIVLQYYVEYFANRTKPIQWISYLSATSVYGDQQGKWVDETTPPTPISARGYHRLLAEQQWQAMGFPLTIFRLSGIYGPNRSAIDTILEGKAQLINKPGHVLNRIHVADICRVILETIKNKMKIVNLADGHPTPSLEVYQYAYQLLGLPIPPFVDYGTKDLPTTLQNFYSENKRIKNDLIKQILKVDLLYPTYKDGLQDCLKWYQKHQKKLT